MDGTTPSTDFVLVNPEDDQAKIVHSNNTKASDFVFVHTSPHSKRRALRSSKELKEQERTDLALKISLGTGQNFEGDDEISPQVAPSSTTPLSLSSEDAPPTLERRPSYKNGRRISGSELVSNHRARDDEGGDDEISPAVVPGPPQLERTASYKNGRRVSSGETPTKTKQQPDPVSPTSVAVAEENMFETGSLSKLLGDALI